MVDKHACVIQQGGIIQIPLELLEKVGVKPGEELIVKAHTNGLVFLKRGNIVARLRGRLKLTPEIVEEIIESEDLEYGTF